jgi:transcriptional antiterminator NusG
MLFAIRTTAGREKQVVDKIIAIVQKGKTPIYSVLAPVEVKGYLFVEAESRGEVQQAVYGVPHVKGVVDGSIQMGEIEHFLSAKPVQIKIDKNDIVEIISGPFKAEKAKVVRVNKVKEEIVVELLEAAVAIPLTVKIDNVRLIKREKEEAK